MTMEVTQNSSLSLVAVVPLATEIANQLNR